LIRQYSKTVASILIAAIVFIGGFTFEVLGNDLTKFFTENPHLKPLLWALWGFCLLAAVFFFVQEHNSPHRHDKETQGTLFGTETAQNDRRAMLRLVRGVYIEGILRRSLWHNARIVLNLEGQPDAVVRPCDLALRRAGQPDTRIAPGTAILEVYRSEREQLLLMGEPGSGKTTLLLEIVEALLQEAEDNPNLPIPVVFNLSTWRKEHTRLDEWLVEQLNKEYGISLQIGKHWVDSGALLLLLDGLDEVAQSHRVACVEAINAYRLQHQKVLRPMVVCCRTHEYGEIPNLQLSGAVIIQPLTRPQVDDYLSRGGKALSGLRAVLKDEPALYEELFATPLMLHVAVLTYEGQTAAALRRSVAPEERRRRLWDAYIERMFERKQEGAPRYNQAQVLEWLAWLGHRQSGNESFRIEALQPDDLPRPWQTFLVRWLLAPLSGIGAFWLFLPGGIGIAAVTAMAWSSLGYGRIIELQPIRRLNLRDFRLRWKSGLIRIVFFAAFGGAFGAAGGAVLAAAQELLDESVIEDTIRPNEGIRHSLRTAAFFAAFFAALGAAFGAALGAAFFVAFCAAVGAAFGATVYGGKTVWQHYLLRFLLWRSGRFPRDITAFLDWAAQRALVQRVGGGWRFVHRTLQERFAELYAETDLAKHPTPTPAVPPGSEP
jgi:hypothetical protein